VLLLIVSNVVRSETTKPRTTPFASYSFTSAERYNERTTLKRHASNLTPEVEVLETALGCVIEGLENNQLLVRFTRVDESRLNREFSFILDVSTRSYKGLFC